MDGELVEPSSGKKRIISHSEVFWEYFPFYLSVGMTPEQYWDGDSRLTWAYRRAYEIKRDRVNESAWLQGMYVYDTLIRVSPVFKDFVKKNVKPEKYMKEPYSISEKQADQKKLREEKKVFDKGLAFMHRMAAASKAKESDKE